ncbi:hypothetical protein F7725_016679 [Dissostichus mawsoni]|uniref:Uncharacterized protein n=1 Tax=Dissostichus mawsoni TaxID=36200 RepID=A0A7J5Z2Z2_DISMA|nr:hypothetical protein F7725_016679 [Dissostichus mawsoni]
MYSVMVDEARDNHTEQLALCVQYVSPQGSVKERWEQKRLSICWMSLSSSCGGVWVGSGTWVVVHNSVGQGVAPVAVVGVGPLGKGVVLALLEGNHSCPGGILVGHGVEEDEDDLVSMGVVWVVVQWGAFLLLRQSSQFSPVAPSLLSQLPHLLCQSGQPCHVTLSVLLQLSHLSPHGGQLSPVAVSVLPQLGELCADGRRVLLDPGVLGCWLISSRNCTSSLSNSVNLTFRSVMARSSWGSWAGSGPVGSFSSGSAAGQPEVGVVSVSGRVNPFNKCFFL